MAKMKLEFDGFENVINQLKKFDADIKVVTDKVLVKTHGMITQNAKEAISPHHRSGRTEESLQLKANPTWAGNTAQVEVGFNLAEGGLPSLFLMYGTPRMKKDQKLYNAFYGTKTLQEIREAQEEVFFNELKKLGG